MPTFEACTKSSKAQLIKAPAKGRAAIFQNPACEKYRVTVFDDCVDTGGGKRADYIITRPGFVSVITELKGKNIKEAGEQIVATKNFLSAGGFAEPHVGALIVSSKVPLGVSTVQQTALLLRKAGIARLRVKNRCW